MAQSISSNRKAAQQSLRAAAEEMTRPTREAGPSRSAASIRFLPRELLRSLHLAHAHGLLIAWGRTVALLEAGAAARVPPRPERRSEVIYLNLGDREMIGKTFEMTQPASCFVQSFFTL